MFSASTPYLLAQLKRLNLLTYSLEVSTSSYIPNWLVIFYIWIILFYFISFFSSIFIIYSDLQNIRYNSYLSHSPFLNKPTIRYDSIIHNNEKWKKNWIKHQLNVINKENDLRMNEEASRFVWLTVWITIRFYFAIRTGNDVVHDDADGTDTTVSPKWVIEERLNKYYE